jgi:hypothetical protein
LVAVAPRTYVLSDDAPPDLPPEFQQSVWINVRAGAWFESDSAKGSSVVDYLATNAKAKVVVTIRKGVATMGTTPPSEVEDSHLIPWSRELVARAKYFLGGIRCGHSATASAQGSAWNEAPFIPTWFRWGDITRSAETVADQPACPAPAGDDGGSGGGGGGDGGVSDGVEWEVCYYTAVYENGVLIDIEEHGCLIFSYPALI